MLPLSLGYSNLTQIHLIKEVWGEVGLRFFGLSILRAVNETLPVTAAERSKACTVFARSEAGTVGSNSTQGMDVGCLCTDRGLATI
jgi:hypothetical protein